MTLNQGKTKMKESLLNERTFLEITIIQQGQVHVFNKNYTLILLLLKLNSEILNRSIAENIDLDYRMNK